MNVEIVEFYPIEWKKERDSLTATLRIRIPDIGIHILGIYVSKAKDRCFFSLPGRLGTHHETGEAVRYPFIIFEDREKQKELMTAIREKGKGFIEKRLDDIENSLVWPQKQKKEDNKRQATETKDNAMEVKQTWTVKKEAAKQVPTIANKVWQDPPPRNSTRKTCAYGKYR